MLRALAECGQVLQHLVRLSVSEACNMIVDRTVEELLALKRSCLIVEASAEGQACLREVFAETRAKPAKLSREMFKHTTRNMVRAGLPQYGFEDTVNGAIRAFK